MSLTDQLGRLEAELNRFKLDNDSLKTRIAKQTGALDESRAQNRQLILHNERLAKRVAYLEKHFYDFHGSAEAIERQRKDMAEPTVAEVVNSPSSVETIKARIARIIKRDEVATGHANNGTVQ
jgi:hypothetical protein